MQTKRVRLQKIYTLYNHAHVIFRTYGFAWKIEFWETADEKREREIYRKKKRIRHGSNRFNESIKEFIVTRKKGEKNLHEHDPKGEHKNWRVYFFVSRFC